jgi:hypothetical protein
MIVLVFITFSLLTRRVVGTFVMRHQTKKYWRGGNYPLDLISSHVVDGRFMAIEQAMGTPKGREAGAGYLREFVEEMKASGFVARGLERSGQGDATVAPKAPVQ